MKVKPISEIEALCCSVGEPLGVRVVEVEFKQGKNPSLTIFIDKEGGMDLDTCELFHNAVSDPLDEFDPTYGLAYTLNVSSPGADRPFKTDGDFLSHIGKKVEVKLFGSVKSKKFLEGILVSYNGEQIVIKTDEKTSLSLELSSVVKVNEYIDFN